MKFVFSTFVNNADQYRNMRESMSRVGYDHPDVEFLTYDNTTGQKYEAYEVFKQHLSVEREYTLCFCHQDLLFDNETRFEHFRDSITQLNLRDVSWAVAGNAGRGHRGEWILHLTDPGGGGREKELPYRVQTLDENFLVFKAGSSLRVSEGLSGFHFYGADICLNAELSGQRSYVIDMPVTHLSPGNKFSEAFNAARDHFAKCWRRKLLVGLIYTTCADIEISRFPCVESFIRQQQIRGVLRRRKWNLVRLPFQPIL